jgi:hypothetical protein
VDGHPGLPVPPQLGGFRNPVTSLRFKRGDAALLEVGFLTNGTTPAVIGDPAVLELQFRIKPRGRYDVDHFRIGAGPDVCQRKPEKITIVMSMPFCGRMRISPTSDQSRKAIPF